MKSRTLAALLAVLPALGFSETIVYPTFTSSAGLQLNGTAQVTTNSSSQPVLRLTTDGYDESGTAFSQAAIPLNATTSFSTAFSFQLSNGGGLRDPDPAGPPGADGIVFTVQNVTNTFGGVGVGLGYAGLSPSLGIEFDTWDDSAAAGFPTVNDPNGNHVGIDVNGNVDSVVTNTNLPGFLNNGAVWYSWVDYNGATDDLQVRLNTVDVRPTSPILEYTALDLAADLGSSSVFAGFTAATGSAYQDQDILSWQFNSSYSPISTVPMSAVPEPATYGWAAAAALAALVAWRRLGSSRARA